MKRIIIPAALVASLALPAFVFAAMGGGDDGRPRIEKMFEKHDTNKDGKVTKDEMSGKKAHFFDRIDLDKDGAITLEEAKEGFARHKEKRMAKMMMKLDTNSDGMISEAEFTNFTLKKFKKADANSDGNLSIEEMERMRTYKRLGAGDWKKES